ncbi:hypothetical protein, partial [Pseudomonas corrugata]|uniref:hypothetical protein n=1 Tax=Pseudomonas corrugata TaxID=47879 RepID=UPI001E46756A
IAWLKAELIGYRSCANAALCDSGACGQGIYPLATRTHSSIPDLKTSPIKKPRISQCGVFLSTVDQLAVTTA